MTSRYMALTLRPIEPRQQRHPLQSSRDKQSHKHLTMDFPSFPLKLFADHHADSADRRNCAILTLLHRVMTPFSADPDAES